MNESSASPPPAVATLDLAPWPQVDFAAFGEVEVKPITKIQKLVGSYLSRNWVMIPHVFHRDEADIGAMEAARHKLTDESGVKVTSLAYFIKAAVAALQALPKFNASIDGSGRNLVFKKYFHIGFAVDTPNGILVPVIRDADRKSIVEIAKEAHDVALQARHKGLPLDRMSGGCFTVSSLGALGGTGFTPIINAPEVAIMGLSRAFQKPFNVDGQLLWRTMVPLSLSYDHRVINGADAARFCTRFAESLAQAG